MSDEYQPFEPEHLNEYSIDLDVGDPSSLQGLTHVFVQGDGTFTANLVIDNSNGEDKAAMKSPERNVKGNLEKKAVENIFRQAHQFPWNRQFPSRPGIPDEAIVVWKLKKANSQLLLKVWLGEAEEDPVLSPVLEELRKTLGELSDNQLFL